MKPGTLHTALNRSLGTRGDAPCLEQRSELQRTSESCGELSRAEQGGEQSRGDGTSSVRKVPPGQAQREPELQRPLETGPRFDLNLWSKRKTLHRSSRPPRNHTIGVARAMLYPIFPAPSNHHQGSSHWSRSLSRPRLKQGETRSDCTKSIINIPNANACEDKQDEPLKSKRGAFPPMVAA